MVEKCAEENKPKTLNIKCGVETGELVVEKFTRGGSSRCIVHPNVPDFLLNPIEFVALAGKSQPWKQGIKSQDKHIQKFIDSKVLSSCGKACTCPACEYTKSNPTDFNKVYLMVYGKESPQKTMNKESQPSTNGTENNNIEEDILIDEFCNDASPFKPKESSDQGEEDNVPMNGVEPIQNGEPVQPPSKNGAKSADTKMAASQSAESKMAANKTTPTKDEDKRVKQGTPDGRRKQKDIRSFFSKTPSEKKNEVEEKTDEKQASKDKEVEKPKTALRIKFEGGELARINSKDDIDLISTADSGKDDITVVSAEPVKEDSVKHTNVKEMSASLLPEVRDEFERSFEQKEAPKVVDTNGEAKEQVRRSKRALEIEIIKEVSKSAKTEPKSTQSSEGKGLKRKRNSSPEIQEIKVKSIKAEPNLKPVKRISPNIANVGTRSWNSKTKIKPVSPKKVNEKPTETPVIHIQGRPKRTIVSPAKLQDPVVITLDSPKKTPIKIKTEPGFSPIRLSPRKYESLLTTPEKLKNAGEKSTPGRIKKEEFVVYKRSSSLSSRAPTPSKTKPGDVKEDIKGSATTNTNTTKTNQKSKQSKQADAKNTQKVSAVVTGNKGKQGVVVKQEPGDGGRDGGEEGKDKTSPSKLPTYANMIKHALSELNTVGGPGCTKLEILLFILRRYKPKDNVTNVTNKLLDALEQNIKKGMLLSSASCTPRKRKDINIKSPVKEKEKSNPKKSPTLVKKKVVPVKGKGNKESGAETAAKTKKKLAVKTNEKVRIIGVKPKKLQEPLAAICKAKKLSRVEALKRVWGYIHANKLLDPQDKSRIICDDKLKKLTKCKAIVSKALLGHVKNAMLAE